MTAIAHHFAPVNDRVSDGAPGRLRDALAAVYAAFELPPPSAIDGCPCCIATRGTDVLLTTPLRQITGQALWRYVSGAFLTIGGEKDFRYFLSRILEVSVSDPANPNDPAIVLGKLALADWRSWTPDEQDAVERFVFAWFEQALADDLADADAGQIGADAESVLCGAARAGMPLDPFFLRLSAPDAAPVLADMQSRFPAGMSGFWDDVPAALRQVSALFPQGRA